MKLLLFANIRRWVRWGAFQQPKAVQRVRIGAGRFTYWQE